MRLPAVPVGKTATLLAAASLTVMAGATIAPALPSMAQHFKSLPGAGDDTEFLVRLALTGPGLFTAVGSLLVGFMIDRVGRLTPMVAGLLLYVAAGTAGLYIETLTQLLIARALLGLAVALVMVATTTIIGDLFIGPARARINGLQGACMSLGGVAFLLVAGFLADVGWRAPFAIYFAALLVLVGTLFTLRGHGAEMTSARPEGAGGVDEPATPRWLLGVVIALGFVSMVLFYMLPTHLPFRLQELGVTERKFGGIAIAVNGLVAGVVAANYGRVRAILPYAGITSVQMLLMGAGFLVIAMAEGLSMVLVGVAINGLGQGLMLPNAMNWLQSLTTAKARGRMSGLLISAIFMGQFLSPVITKPIGDRVGLAGEYLVAACAMGVLAVVFAVWAITMRKVASG